MDVKKLIGRGWRRFIEQVENQHFLQLLWAFYRDEDIARAMQRATATNHDHAHLSGLLEAELPPAD